MKNDKQKKTGPISGIKSEIKKISYPSMSKTIKQTSIVIAVVLVFSTVILLFDRILSTIYSWLVL